MRAAIVKSFGGPEAVEIVEVPVPEPGPGQVRVKVAAAALNPVDAGVRAGAFGDAGPVGLGWDLAGTVDAVGTGVTGPAVGDAVVGLVYGPVKPLGSHAEYVVLDAGAVAAAPRSADSAHAATLPLNGLAAAQAVDLLALERGASVLVTGAAGGLGGYAVALARIAGHRVTAMASPADEDLVRSFGADDFLPRSATDDPAASFDGVVDAAVIGAPALAFVRDGGAYAGVIPGAQPGGVRGIRTGAIEVRPDGARLAELVRLADEGRLRLRVAATYPLAQVRDAHARLDRGGLRGRLVLVP
ncbi:NADP-dependent oxidoreductase [Nonomuraea sp. NPDC049725]|uniref:NADP-dependent oxidoreductase n=1 Tax=Nonomuraea sp. NPDC049725 TaxID=3154508 RepID=UPI003449D7A3